MTNENDQVQKPKLATVKEAADAQYVRVAKDYFTPKKAGVTTPALMKYFVWIGLLMSVGMMLPQVFSERSRQEVAEKILPPTSSPYVADLQIPPIQSGAGHEDKRQNDGQRIPSPPVQRIKSIDLRALGDPPPGSQVTGALASGGANGMVKVKLTENLILNGDTYAVKNSVLMGQGSSSDERLFIKFFRLVSPEGKSRKISAQAYDIKDGIRGLSGRKVSSEVFKIAASSALIFMGGVADSMQEGSSGPFGNQRRSLHDAAMSGVAQAASAHGKRYLDKLDQDSRVEVQKETELTVIFESGDDKNE